MKDFEILSRDTVVAVWKDNELKVLNNDLLPLYLKRVSDAKSWLETRAIDSHRANSRLLKKALRLAEKDDVSTVLYVNAATITDTYWVRAIGSDLKYEDVRFGNDYSPIWHSEDFIRVLILPQSVRIPKHLNLPISVVLKSVGN